MRTFIIRARKGTTRWQRVREQLGTKGHFEVLAHSVINAFFISNDFRMDTEVYLVLDSSEDFPRTIKLSSSLSLSGFHEDAVIQLIEKALKKSDGIKKNQTRAVDAGVEVSGFGFERLISHLIQTRRIYLLDPKGESLRTKVLSPDPVFVLSDHIALPKKTLSSLKRQGLGTISLGKKMLFASQCIVIIHYEVDFP